MDVIESLRPSVYAKLFVGAQWVLECAPDGLAYFHRGELATLIPYGDIVGIAIEEGAFWNQVHLSLVDDDLRLQGAPKTAAGRFATLLRATVGQVLLRRLEPNREALEQLWAELNQLLAVPNYLGHREVSAWIVSVGGGADPVSREAAHLIQHPLFPKQAAGEDLRGMVETLADVLVGARTWIQQRNRNYVLRELATHQAFFNTVEQMPLTQEQCIAAITLEDRNQLVAAAGSGKTSSIVGKVGYALISGAYAPDDLLVLAFNNSAADELAQRMASRLAPLLGDRTVMTKTFHAFGKDVIARADGRQPSVANWAAGGEAADRHLIQSLIDQCTATDPAFMADWVLFRSVCLRPAKDPTEFQSLEAWNQYLHSLSDYRDGQAGLFTLAGEVVKSQGELAIANWLYLNGVAYEYERPYIHDTADSQYRQYRPDFYFPEIDTYLEHYAIGRDGKPAACFGQEYAQGMAWKDRIHREGGTALITTTFAEFADGSLFSKLQSELERRGLMLRSRSIEEVLERLNQTQKAAEYTGLFRTFLQHAKSNEVTPDELPRRAAAHRHAFRAQVFARVAGKLMAAYERKLRDAGEIDFEDMIQGATRAITSGRYRHHFRMILVDEFQDLSQSRGKLLKALLAQSPDCKLFGVGDDWQSINRFAGADLDLFTRFDRHFGPTAVNHLTKTFRSNQGIATVAAEFVQRNSGQLRKRVATDDPAAESVIQVRRYQRLDEIDEVVLACLREIASHNAPSLQTVFVLGRYRGQKPRLLESWGRAFAQLQINYSTIHGSKGLQADAVILLGLHAGSWAFPSEIVDDPLLGLVMPNLETYPYAEERRLFYVALTRARHRVFLLGSKGFPSAFLKEILAHEGSGKAIVEFDPLAVHQQLIGQRCPRCGKGTIKRKWSDKYGAFAGCSGYPTCNFTADLSGRYGKQR